MGTIDFDRYKSRLIDYLRLRGIEAEIGQSRCCPWHEDSTPSFSVFAGDGGHPAFNCFGCGRAGDIYKAVEYCEGETDPKKQFETIERLFGGAQTYTAPRTSVKKTPFRPDPAALSRLTEWLAAQPKADELILGYFAQRAQVKSAGEIWQYPKEILPNLPQYFHWWPGSRAAEKALGKRTLFAAGVPWSTKDDKLPEDERRIAWYHSGVLAKSPEGFKLLYMDGTESEKRNPRRGVSYCPVPASIPTGGTIILLEGEIDAILCQAIGIENAFSMGGKGGLTKERIQKYIIPAAPEEIILFADNDKDGGSQKKFGLLPLTEADHIRETIPGNLRKMGYAGKIRVTSLPPESPYKDPDDAIRNGHADIVREAIAKATDCVPQAEENQTPGASDKPRKNARMQLDVSQMTEWEHVPAKFLRSLLKKIPYSDLDAEEAEQVVIAVAKSCKKDEMDLAANALAEWSLHERTPEEAAAAAKQDGTPFELLTIAARHGVSEYQINRLKELLVPAAEILNTIERIDTILPIDYDALVETKKFQAFLKHCDHAFASYALAHALKGRLLYIEHEEANYVYTGNYWVRIPSIATEAHAALINALLCYLCKYPRDKKPVLDCIKTIGSNTFRQKLANDLNKKEAQFYHDEKKDPVLFDSFPVRETLTLKDGVLDFSGEKIRFRKGRPEEYRLTVLPYTCREIRDAASPDLFLRLLDLDFDRPADETLKKNPVRTIDTLLHALSLIISRNVSKNYVMFLTGSGGTGKSTLMSIIEETLGNENIAQLNSRVLVNQKRGFDNENGPSPEIAELEGKLLAVTMELPEDGKLNSDQLKRLTGNDLISARQLRQGLHKFRPTAQVCIVGNTLPSFYKHDSGIIRRLLVFHFNVEHAKRARTKDHKERYKGIPSDTARMMERLTTERAGIIRLLAERYIDLKQNHALNIPVSQECENAKSQYIEAQSKDTDEFYEACVRFTPGDDNAFIFSDDLYRCYLNFKGYQEGSREALTQKAFTFYLKKDHPELNGSNYCQKRPGGNAKPKYGFKFISFTEMGKEYIQSEPDGTLGIDQPAPMPEPPSDDPFAEKPPYDPPPPLIDEDGNEYDIF